MLHWMTEIDLNCFSFLFLWQLSNQLKFDLGNGNQLCISGK